MSKRSSRNKKGGDGNVPNFVFKLGDNTSGFGSTPSSPSGSVTGFTFSNPSSPATAGFSNFGTLQRGQSEINPKPESSPLRRTTSDIGLNTQSAFTFGQQSSTQSSFGATLQRQDSTASLNSQSSFSAPATINNGLNTSGTAGNAPGAFGFAASSTTTSAPVSAISFGAPSTTPTATTASSFTTPAFTFGTSATPTAASTAVTSTSSASAFTFGAPSSTTTTSTTSTSTPVSAFSFGTPSTTTTSAATTAPTTAFSFGTPSTTTTSAATTAPTTAFSFGTTSTATPTTATTSTQAPSFTFGTPASTTTSTQKSTTTPASTGFSFGTPSTTATSSTTSTTATTSAATISFGTTATSKPTSSPFTFGTPSSTATSTPATSTSISFGTTDKKSTAETTSSKPADTKLSFGTADKKEDNKSTVTSSPFTFGTSAAATAITTPAPAAPAKPNQFSFVKVLEDLEKAAISQVPNQFHATLIGPALIQQTVHHTSFRIDNIMPTTRFTELPEQAQKELDELEKYIRLENQRNEYIKNHKIPRYFDTISQSKKNIDLLSQELDAFSNTLKCTKESIEFLYDTVKEQLRHANDGSIVLEACKHPGNNARWLFGYTEEDDYFLQLSKQLSNRLEEYKKCIWEIERTAESWTQNKKQSPQDIANIMRTQNEAFMALSNKVAALHESVSAEKNNYNQYLRMYN